MAADITCARCGQTREGLDGIPFPGPIGARAQQEICKPCWAEWQRQQMMLINHYGLNLMDPQARTFLTTQMKAFLFGGDPKEEIDTTKQGTINW